jgi:hypothetical protein
MTGQQCVKPEGKKVCKFCFSMGRPRCTWTIEAPVVNVNNVHGRYHPSRWKEIFTNADPAQARIRKALLDQPPWIKDETEDTASSYTSYFEELDKSPTGDDEVAVEELSAFDEDLADMGGDYDDGDSDEEEDDD